MKMVFISFCFVYFSESGIFWWIITLDFIDNGDNVIWYNNIGGTTVTDLKRHLPVTF